METIKETLNKYRSDNHLIQSLLCTRLKVEMEQTAKNHLGWRLLTKMINRYDSQNPIIYHPDNVERVVSNMISTDNISDLFKLLDFYEESKINVDGLIQNIRPTLNIDISSLQIVTTDFIESRIRENCTLQNLEIHVLDHDYRLITHDDLNHILETNLIDQMPFVAESCDCDDYGFALKGFLSRQGLGNLTVFYCEVLVCDYETEEYEFTHSLYLAVVMRHGHVETYYVEPQKDKVWSPKEPMLWNMEQKSLKLKFLLL